jgi:putative hemolysin
MRALLALVITAAALPAMAQAPQRATLANPASKNCAAKGGKLSIERNGKGGQFGVCTFPDNLQCEEWAMMRGECPTGGIKVTGYVTPAARYCAITGGTYAVTAAGNTAVERGTCTFADGKECAAAAYFNGTCSRQVVAAAKTIKADFACADGKSIDATFVNGPKSSVRLVLSDGRRVTLPQAMSASGARYANKDESFVFWNKGNTAFIEEKGKTTYDGCAAK